MSDPNSALYWLIGLVCCPGPLMFVAGILVTNAFHRGWINLHVDRSRAPRFGRRDAE